MIFKVGTNVVTPVSGIMGNQLSEEFTKKVLYDNNAITNK